MSEKRANFNSWVFKALFTFPIKRFAPFSVISSKIKYSEYWKNFLLASTRRRLWYDMWVRKTHHNNIVYAETIEREREMKCESKWIMFACGACYYIFLPYIHCCCVMIEQLMKNPFSIFLFFPHFSRHTDWSVYYAFEKCSYTLQNASSIGWEKRENLEPEMKLKSMRWRSPTKNFLNKDLLC